MAASSAVVPPSTTATRQGGLSVWAGSLAALGVLFAAMIGLYWDAVSGAVTVWYDSRTFNHCFLVIPMAGYLIWDRREWLRGIAPKPFWPALVLLPAGGAVWLIAYTAGILEGQQLALFGLIQVTLLVVLGLQVYRLLLFPFLFLAFLVPTGEYLVPSLQDFTAWFTVLGLQLTGVPVFSDGVFISIPNGNFHVAEACAGLRFLIATIAFGFLFADLIYRSWVRRVLFILLCLVVPLIANGFRAYGIVMIAHLSDNTLAVGVDHLVYGWVFFSMVTVLLIVIGMRFRDDGPDRDPRQGAVQDVVAPPVGRVIAAGAAVLLLLAVPSAYGAYVEREQAPAARLSLSLPLPAGPWQATPAPDPAAWRPSFPNADAESISTLTDGTRRVQVYFAYYRWQNQRKKMIGGENRLVDGQAWEYAARFGSAISLDGATLPVAGARLRASGRQETVLYWYWVDGRFTASALMAKLYQAKAMILTGRSDAAFLAISTPEVGAGEPAAETLRDFVSRIGPLGSAIDKLRRG